MNKLPVHGKKYEHKKTKALIRVETTVQRRKVVYVELPELIQKSTTLKQFWRLFRERPKRSFTVRAELEAVLTVDASTLDPEQLRDTAEAIAESLIDPNESVKHIAYNMVVNRLSLESIDGFANLPNDRAKLESELWDFDVAEIKE